MEGELWGITASVSSASRLAGAANNLVAVEWELDVMQWAPEPVALSHTVQPPSCPAVTIDVVGAGGRWWLEAKASLPFGLGSSAWIDLEQQLSRLTRSARASFCGTARPDVLVVFKHPCPAEVQSALIDIGVTCITPHPDGSLPDPATVSSLVRPDAPTPLQPPCVLLDVSSLLCLISSLGVPCFSERPAAACLGCFERALAALSR